METILTADEVAAMLKMQKTTVYAAAKRKEIPAFKLAGRWKFPAQALQQWIAEKAGVSQPSKTLGLTTSEE